MNQQELYDKIQAVNNFRWNQETIEVENYGTDGSTLIVKPLGWKCITHAFIQDLEQEELTTFADFDRGGLVVY